MAHVHHKHNNYKQQKCSANSQTDNNYKRKLVARLFQSL